jgi:RHS repeat-associated protein
MPRAARRILLGCPYRAMNRGSCRQAIFHKPADDAFCRVLGEGPGQRSDDWTIQSNEPIAPAASTATFGAAGAGRVKTDFGGTDDLAYAMARDASGRFVLAGYAGTDLAVARYHGVTQTGSAGTQRQWVQQDANFNVTSIADNSGNVLERYRYTPYGERTVLNAAGSAPVAGNASAHGMQHGHQGGRADAATGLILFNVGGNGRYYSPTLGRWTSRDKLRYIDGANLYLYLSDNPLGATDQNGNADPRAIGAAIALAIAMGYAWWNYSGTPHAKDLGVGCAALQNQLAGLERAKEALDRRLASGKYNSRADLLRRLEDDGVVLIGLRGIGAVGEGARLSDEEQQIVNHFESFAWNEDHPEANHHPAEGASDNRGFGERWDQAESERLEAVIKELENAIECKGCP